MKNSSKIYSFLVYAYDISTNFWYMFLHLFSVIPESKTSFSILITVFALILFNLLARKPNLEKKIIFIQTNSFIMFTCTNPVLLVPGCKQVLLVPVFRQVG